MSTPGSADAVPASPALTLDTGERPVVLSVLDLAPLASGVDAGQALRNSADLARRVEALGYHRYWVAEHHNMPGIASSSPAVLLAHLAAVTTTMRLGSGGVMLPNHPPLVVAEQFGMLASLHPGRIDLGIGRAPGTDQLTARALRRQAGQLGAEDFPNELGELMAFLGGRWPEDHPYRAVRAVPRATVPPSIWLLGSSGYSAQLAGMLGLPFAFAHHFSARNTEPALELYRRSFEPSEVLSEPYTMIGVVVVCAPTDDEARWYAAPSGLSMLRLRTGRPGAFPTPEEAAAHRYTPAEEEFLRDYTASHVVGDPEAVRSALAELARRTGVDELMLTTNVGDHAARVRSFELVADAARQVRRAEAS